MKNYAAQCYQTSLSIREQIARMEAEGLTPKQMSQALGLEKTTVYYHRRCMGLVEQKRLKKLEFRDRSIKAAGEWLSARWTRP